MTYKDLENLAKNGKLSVSKTLYRERERYAKYPSEEIVKYKVYSYTARTSDMSEGQAYKIRAEDYKKLCEIISNV